MIYTYGNKTPDIKKALFVAESADIAGDVTLEEDVSIWFNVSIRGDIAPVSIGTGSNVQDNSVIHVDVQQPTHIGKYVTIGHGAIIHACTIEDCSLIGMGAIILDRAVIGTESIVGAGALVTQGKHFPPRSLIIGSPAKVVRELTEEEAINLKKHGKHYVEIAAAYENP